MSKLIKIGSKNPFGAASALASDQDGVTLVSNPAIKRTLGEVVEPYVNGFVGAVGVFGCDIALEYAFDTGIVLPASGFNNDLIVKHGEYTYVAVGRTVIKLNGSYQVTSIIKNTHRIIALFVSESAVYLMNIMGGIGVLVGDNVVNPRDGGSYLIYVGEDTDIVFGGNSSLFVSPHYHDGKIYISSIDTLAVYDTSSWSAPETFSVKALINDEGLNTASYAVIYNEGLMYVAYKKAGTEEFNIKLISLDDVSLQDEHFTTVKLAGPISLTISPEKLELYQVKSHPSNTGAYKLSLSASGGSEVLLNEGPYSFVIKNLSPTSNISAVKRSVEDNETSLTKINLNYNVGFTLPISGFDVYFGAYDPTGFILLVSDDKLLILSDSLSVKGYTLVDGSN